MVRETVTKTMSRKRKVQQETLSTILGTEDLGLLEILDEEDEDENLNHKSYSKLSLQGLDDGPDTSDPYYYEDNSNLHKEIAFYNSLKSKGDAVKPKNQKAQKTGRKLNKSKGNGSIEQNTEDSSNELKADEDKLGLEDHEDDEDQSDDENTETSDDSDLDDESDDLNEESDVNDHCSLGSASESENEDVEDEGSDTEDEGYVERQTDEGSPEEEGKPHDEVVRGKLKSSFALNKGRSQLGTKSSENKQKDPKGSPKTAEKAGVTTDGVKAHQQQPYDEYADGDSSDEEEIMNTIGNVPTEWYDECDHVGFDHTGEKIYKPDKGDGLDAFLRRIEDPNYMRTVVDRLTGQDVVLVDDDLELIQRLVKCQVPSAQYNLYEPFLDLFSHEVMETPLSGRPEHKRSFLPSRSERAKVSKMVHNIKQNLIHQHQRPKRYQPFDLWKSDHIPVPMRRRVNAKYRAPPARLPTNSNSYNPPPEFIPTKFQMDWIRSKHVKQRAEILNRLPKKFDSLRCVPNHKTYVMDVFNRCLDLYMSSRFAYKKVIGRSKDLLPELPRPRDLRPFPTSEVLQFLGHKSIVRVLAVHPFGKILATGSDDHTVKIWDISNGRCIRTLDVGDVVTCLAWNPSSKVLVLAVCAGKSVIMVNPESYLTEASIVTRTNALFRTSPDQGDYEAEKKVERVVTWAQPSSSEREQGYRIVLKHLCVVQQVVWHPQGDYFATLQREAKSASVMIHQLSRHRSQIPFSKSAIRVTAMSFHPKKAYFYICSQGRVRVYSLLQKKLIRLIRTPASSTWISSIAVHPSGEHFIVGSHGKRLTWYEMEATNRPHMLRYHHGAVRCVAFHNKYPLLASAADDGRVVVAHAMVYNDWIKDPLIVPLKELQSHAFLDGLCVLQLAWHPFNPVLFTAGADGTVRLWQ